MRITLGAALSAVLTLSCGGDVTVVDDDGEGGTSSQKGPSTVGSSSDGAGAPNGPNGSGPSGSGGSGLNGSGVGGSSQNGSGAGGGQQICDDFGTPCTECVAEACPSDWCACTATADCPALFGCTNMCNGDQACNQQCLDDHQAGISAAFLVSSCAGGPCSASCPQGGEELEPCGTCLFQSCDDEMNACLVEPSCMPLWNCLIDCPQLDLSCQEGCYDTYGEGVDELEPVLDCASANCQPVCGDD